ncbi:MAG TPA: hypothetical protein VD905_11930 [Flavobacteriales bacterium]|nr:hypothetical protein [Flavobacteriales bacterium]
MKDNYVIQELIEHNNFEALSAEEKKMVLSEITQEEYESRRAIVLDTRLFLATGVENIKPDAALKNRVAALMQVKKQQQKGFAFLVTFQIPAYAAVAAILVLVTVLYPRESPPKNQLAVVDTVYRTADPVYIHDTVVKEKSKVHYVKVPVIKVVEMQRTEIDLPASAMVEQPLNAGIVPTVTLAQEQLQGQLQNIGQSSSEQEELNKFLVPSR